MSECSRHARAIIVNLVAIAASAVEIYRDWIRILEACLGVRRECVGGWRLDFRDSVQKVSVMRV